LSFSLALQPDLRQGRDTQSQFRFFFGCNSPTAIWVPSPGHTLRALASGGGRAWWGGFGRANRWLLGPLWRHRTGDLFDTARYRWARHRMRSSPLFWSRPETIASGPH